MFDLTREQVKLLRKAQRQFLFKTLWLTVKLTPILFVMNFCTILINHLYVHSETFSLIAMLINLLVVLRLSNKDMVKNFEEFKVKVSELLK